MKTISFTKFASDGAPLTKEFTLVEGKISKNSSAHLLSGKADRISATFTEFKELLENANEKEAFGYGLHDAFYPDHINITVNGSQKPKRNLLARTKQFFSYRNQPGILMLDHDPDEYGQKLTDKELIDILIEIDPNTKDAATIVRGSVSAGVHLKGDMPKQGKGFHIYIPVKDASDIPRYGKLLFDHLWLNGYGFFKISRDGRQLDRSPIDGSVFSGERLDFVGKPIISHDALVYTPPALSYEPGVFLDTRKLPDLTSKQSDRLNALLKEKKGESKPLAQEHKKRWINDKATEISEKTGESKESIAKQLKQCLKSRKYLIGNFPLFFADGTKVLVSEVLENPQAYDQKALADPIEGPEYGKTTAKFYWNDGDPIIHSYAHGEAIYSFSEPKKRLLNNVDAYFQHQEILSSDEALAKTKSAISKWFARPKSCLGVKAPAGIGKTNIVLKEVAKYAQDKLVEIYVPTHKLAEEVKVRLLKINPKLNIVAIRGRTNKDKIGNSACKYPEKIKAVQGYGYNIMKDICSKCEYFEQDNYCAYIDQFNIEANVRIYPHSYLKLGRSLDTNLPGRIIIDERFFHDLIDITNIPLSSIKKILKKPSDFFVHLYKALAGC